MTMDSTLKGFLLLAAVFLLAETALLVIDVRRELVPRIIKMLDSGCKVMVISDSDERR